MATPHIMVEWRWANTGNSWTLCPDAEWTGHPMYDLLSNPSTPYLPGMIIGYKSPTDDEFNGQYFEFRQVF